MRLPSHEQVQRGLLIILVVALIPGLSRDVAPTARDAGQTAAVFALGAMVVLDAGARRRAVS